MFKKLIITLLSLHAIGAGAQEGYDPLQVLTFCKNQDYEQALHYLTTVPAPEQEQYLFDLGYVHYMNDQFTEALSAFTKLYQKNPQLPAPQLYLARLSNMKGDEQNALFYYKNLIRLLPDRYKYWHAAATVWSRLRQPDSAIAYIRKSYALRPQAGQVVYDYATYLDNAKQKKEAEAIVDRFLQSDTSYLPVMGKKVNLCFSTGRYQEAIAWGERLRAQDPLPVDRPGVYINLLYSYLNLKQPDSVLRIFSWLELQGIGGESAAYGAALAHSMKKNYVVSDSLLTECIAFNIQEMAATYLRAKAGNALATNNYTRAVALYDTSYYIFKDPIDLFQAGTVFDSHLKNRARAAGYYKRFLRARPVPKTSNEEDITQYIKAFLNLQKN
ncbi:tetratricopeptide repeat protein [Niabella aurantiaca]|uniref:tetratricopeptide repeat protein n=1 Tax=Niabella aurantiaca TaxID=379900 RepID=UPI00037D5471|nr:tetratricopeptide repeat protein [Niabella aurantiaca]